MCTHRGAPRRVVLQALLQTLKLVASPSSPASHWFLPPLAPSVLPVITSSDSGKKNYAEELVKEAKTLLGSSSVGLSGSGLGSTKKEQKTRRLRLLTRLASLTTLVVGACGTASDVSNTGPNQRNSSSQQQLQTV